MIFASISANSRGIFFSLNVGVAFVVCSWVVSILLLRPIEILSFGCVAFLDLMQCFCCSTQVEYFSCFDNFNKYLNNKLG
jgi:hypothetical protein